MNVGSGLGNQLFQLGFLHFSSVLFEAIPILEDSHKNHSPHSNINYFQSIFKDFVFLGSMKAGRRKCIRENHEFKVENWQERIGGMRKAGDTFEEDTVLEFTGYFQQWVYMDGIRDTFVSTLNFNEQKKLNHKYPFIHDQVFVHIRGGDYLTPALAHHFVDLRKYYSKCRDLCKEKGNDKFVIFTNDSDYAKDFLTSNNLFLDAPLIDENELDSLYLMSLCKACICANSTFSWWGAYLNKDRTIYLPSQWFSGTMANTNVEGYFFPESSRVSVE